MRRLSDQRPVDYRTPHTLEEAFGPGARLAKSRSRRTFAFSMIVLFLTILFFALGVALTR